MGKKTLSKVVKMEDEKVTVDETLVLRFEDSTQPSKRIKQEPTDPDAKESKVIVDAMKQTETFDTDLKVQIASQTDRPLIYSCKCCYEKFRSSEKIRSHLLYHHNICKEELEADFFKQMMKGHTDEEDSDDAVDAAESSSSKPKRSKQTPASDSKKKPKIRDDRIRKQERARSIKHYKGKIEKNDYFCPECKKKCKADKSLTMHLINMHGYTRNELKKPEWKEVLRGTPRK